MRGKFWPDVRRRMRTKALDLFHRDNPQAQGVTPTKNELRESGYWYDAKIEVLREIYREKHGALTSEEEQFKAEFEEWLEENKDAIQKRTY